MRGDNMSLEEWIAALVAQANLTQEFYDDFIKRLSRYDDITEELRYYMEYNDFKDSVNIKGYSVTDILVWQIDHFKSHMDRGEYDYQSNQSYMILKAYDTLMKMKEDPDSIILSIKGETGTDYADKY